MSTFATSIIIWSSLAASSFVAAMFLINLLFFRKTKSLGGLLSEGHNTASVTCEVSVLVPARNEALRIGPLLDSVLESQGVRCEICVLDDESQDGTAAIVQDYSQRHSNVRLLKGASIPAGWSGKQFACYQLAQQATHEEMIFLDADVHLSKNALLRAVDQRRRSEVDLLSGFPRQRVVSMGEQLLIPLIHLILLCFLPFVLMRWTRMVGAAAGCGQFFLTTKMAYERSGGHRSIKQSLHDGIMLPRAYRKSGLKTDLCDASDLATCRMYTSFEETWSGLLKNASEGFAKMPLLPVVTLLMLFAFVCPVLCLAGLAAGLIEATWLPMVLWSCAMSYLPRILCCLKFDRAWVACLFSPISILLFLVIQWTALIRKSRGRGVQWRQRDYAVVPS
ncbi:MAG TPA: glycosyl transferase [Planctomycetaceae bacterium]|nr:glycosyl transferase [Planctomycetaceae bacterium]